jgi:hypothetical protein
VLQSGEGDCNARTSRNHGSVTRRHWRTFTRTFPRAHEVAFAVSIVAQLFSLRAQPVRGVAGHKRAPQNAVFHFTRNHTRESCLDSGQVAD